MSYWVYVHTCPNGKRYVGCTTQARPEHRWLEGRGYRHNDHFYRAILKYGWSNFQHEVFEVDSAEEMYRKEVELISFYHSNDPKYGYNHSSGGEKSASGCIRSEETRKKMSEAQKGKTHSEETRKKISQANKGKPHKPFSEEARKHISESLKGKIHSEEHRRHVSESLRGKSKPRIKISLPDGTIVEITKQHLIKDYVNKNKAFQYVS